MGDEGADENEMEEFVNSEEFGYVDDRITGRGSLNGDSY